jgi:hypothetical protein
MWENETFYNNACEVNKILKEIQVNKNSERRFALTTENGVGLKCPIFQTSELCLAVVPLEISMLISLSSIELELLFFVLYLIRHVLKHRCIGMLLDFRKA